MPYKLATINSGTAKKGGPASDIYIAQPDSIKEALAGKLFILVEIESPYSNSIKIINFLIDRLNTNYYQNDKLLLRERISTLKVEHIFEAALAKTNQDYLNWLGNEKIKAREIAVNLTVGLIHEDVLYFSNLGKNKVFLIYKTPPKGPNNRRSNSESDYKMSDIAKESGDNTAPVPGKLFSNVTSGPIPSGANILVTNEALPEYMSEKQLIPVLSTLPPMGAVEQLKNTLAGINTYVTFLGIIIKNSLPDKTAAAADGRVTTSESISSLNQTEENTENLLSPTGMIKVRKWFRLPGLFARGENESVPGRDSTINLKDSIYVKKKTWLIVKKTVTITKNGLYHFFNLLFFLFKAISGGKKISLNLSGLRARARRIGGIFSHLSFRHKILVTLSVICLILFTVSLAYNRAQKKQEQTVENYQELTDLIEKKENQAEASLLYSNEEGAKKLFDEITGLMQELPQVTDEQKARYETFQANLEKQLEQTRRVVRVDDAPVLADLTNLASGAKPDNITLVLPDNKLYIADSSQKSIYIADPGNGMVTSATDLEVPISTLYFPAPLDNALIYYFNQTSIIELSLPDAAMSDLSIGLLGDAAGVSGLQTYNSRLYLLSKSDNQVYRYNRSGSGFSSAYGWLNGQNDLSQAVDMAIDGYVYVLNGNGTVLKFLRGEPTDFKIEGIDPPLQNTTKIKVSLDLDYIYILEPGEKRLAVFDKTGQFILQYKSDKFNALQDFAVDEAGKKIYFLNGSLIYAAAATHLEN